MPRLGPHMFHPTQGGLGLAASGVFARIPHRDGEWRQKGHAAFQRPQRRMIAEQFIDKADQVVGLGHGESKLFQQSFEVFFCALLGMKTHGLMKSGLAAGASLCDDSVDFRFSHPFVRGRPHREFSRWTRCNW